MRQTTSFFFFLIVLAGMATPVGAQDRRSKEPSWAEIQQQMHEMQRQMMEELQRSPFFRGDWMTPDSTGSSFFFRIDTSFNNDPHRFFRDLFGDEFEGDFFGFDAPRRQHPHDAMPPDDGEWRERGDGSDADELLPEERLRRRQDPDKPGRSNHGRQKAASGELKTIRI